MPSTTAKCLRFECRPLFFFSRSSLNFKPRAFEPALLTAYLWRGISLFNSANSIHIFRFKYFFRLNLRSPIHGRGLFCTRNIAAGEMVIEYSGMLIRSVLTDKREKYYESKVGNHIYLTWVTFLTLPSARLVIINHFTPRSYGLSYRMGN